MSTVIDTPIAVEMTAFLTIFPRMEATGVWHKEPIPLNSGWHAQMGRLLEVTMIPEAEKRDRYTGSGKKKPLAAKSCAPGVAPYLLRQGGRRRKSDVMANDCWSWLPLDLDAVDLPVDNLLDIGTSALGDHKLAAWTTWSCRDGYASARLLIPLAEPVTFADLCKGWWWARRRLLDAGLPVQSVKTGEPAVDSRLDARLYYLPSVPTPQTLGNEKWGGVRPRGFVSPDDVPVLDLRSILDEGASIEKSDRPEHETLFPGVPVPGGSRGRRKKPIQATYTGNYQELSLSTSTTPSAAGKAEYTESLHPDLQARAEALSPGQEIREDECPYCGYSSDRVGLLQRRNDGRISFRCWKEQLTRIASPSAKWGQTFARKTDPQDAGPTLIQLREEDLTPEGWLDARKLVTRGVIPRGVATMILRVGQDRGKTHFATSVARGALKAGKRVVGVAPTRSLSRGLAARLGIDCYLALDNAAQAGGREPDRELTGSVVVCTPSTPRVQTLTSNPDTWELDEDPIDVLILDEIEQQIRTLRGKHLADGQAREGWMGLITLVRQAEHVVMMDADAGPLTRELLIAAEKWEPGAIWIDGPGSRPRPWSRYARRNLLITDLRNRWIAGERPVVACGSAKEAASTAEILQKLAPERRVACLTSDTIGDYDLSRIGDWIGDYDALVYSPVIGTGVSVDIQDHFSRVYLILSRYVGTAYDAMQMASRVRHPIHREVRFWGAAGGTPRAWQRDPQAILSVWAGRDRKLRARLGMTRTPPTGLEWEPEAKRYSRLMALSLASDYQTGLGWTGDALTAYLCHLEMPVTMVGVDSRPGITEDVVKEERKVARKKVETERVRRILQAPELSEEKTRELRRRGPRSRKEADALRRRGISDFYEEVTEEIVRFDGRKGAGREKLRQLRHVMAMAEGGAAAQTLLLMDEADIQDDVSPARLRARVLKAASLLRILQWAGVDPKGWGQTFVLGNNSGPLAPPPPIDAERVEVAGRRAYQHQVEFRRLGVAVGRSARSNPTQFLSGILRQMGIRLTYRRDRSRGPTRGQRTKWIDPESLQKALQLSEPYQDRLRAGTVGGEDGREHLRILATLPSGLAPDDLDVTTLGTDVIQETM